MKTETNDNDPRVTRAYREISAEKTPPDLDEKILSMAADNARSPYGLARAWMRPVAWAATIGLSLAFILELSQMPETTPATRSPRVLAEPEPASQSDRDMPSVREDFQTDDMSMLHDAEEQVRRRSGPARQLPAAAEFAAYPEKKEQAEYCDADARRSAATWYTCIRELRDNGLGQAAELEMDKLMLEFPDFEEFD